MTQQVDHSTLRAPKRILREFLEMEASGGIILVFAAIVAIVIANSSLFPFYNYILNEVDFRVGFNDSVGFGFEIKKPLLLWINDGFMAIFFFLVGLEIKREILEGELSSRERALLPAFGAIGGMVVPALIYYFINIDDPEALRGWAIPAATDIAFALGVLSLLGSRAPIALKVLLTAVAIIDDLGAIVIIALFYSDKIVLQALFVAVFALIGLLTLNLKKVSSLTPYILLGFLLWVCVLKSGVHATLAGVFAALFIPLKCSKDPSHSPAKSLEHALHPWVAFMILPIFAFANAGVPLKGLGLDDLLTPITLGIALGLFIGKQIGVFGFMVIAIVFRISPKPEGTSWLQLYAVSLLCGIGFTMSLFIGGLAFETLDKQASIRIGVLAGSIVSAIMAYLLLRYAPNNNPALENEKEKAT